MWLSHIPKLSISGLLGDLSEPKPWWSVANQIARLDQAIHSLCLTASQMVSLFVSQETAGEKFGAEFCMRKTQNTKSLFLAKVYGSYFKSWVILGIFFCWYNSNYLLPDSFNQMNFKICFFQCLFTLFDRLCNKTSIISQCNYYIHHQVNILIIKWLHGVEAFQTTQKCDFPVFCAATSSHSLG